MTEYLTISNEPPEHPGMNFALLRQEGIKYIERLAGKLWTDYNTHDPGITILEQLCYAITDLSYRLSFDIKDLLAYPPNTSAEAQKQFFTAREILTNNPLTINDYRQLIIDIDGVKNAWLEKIDEPLTIYYDPNHYTLTFTSAEFNEQVKLNGLYRVLIEKEKGIDSLTLEQKVKSRLHQYRNLCEDFEQIKVLPVEEISIKAEIEIEDGFDANDLMAQIYFGLDNFISPSIQFFTLKELLEKGKTPEEIFNATPLEHGFIDEEQLQQFGRKAELHTSDLIQIILDIKGVKTVRSLLLSSSNQPQNSEAWVLALNPDNTPQLKSIDAAVNNDILFYKGQISYSINLEKVKNKLQSLQKETTKISSTLAQQDISIPPGEYRELFDYESIQNDFPASYGIGELGLPASASPKRKAQAKQLQAYLMFFDQLLANYFAQLDHFKDLFSFHTQEHKTYFSQMLNNVPGVKEILTEYPEESIQAIDLERRNRFLDHLMAQFCEKFTDYSVFLYQSLPEKLIEDKVAFLQDYLAISSERGKAFNYTDSNKILDTDNVSGLQRRIGRLLGIPYTRKNLASADAIAGFHLIEHILLRPRNKKEGDFLSFSYPIIEFSQSTEDSTKTICTSAKHGLMEDEQIQILDAGSYNGSYSVTNITQDTFSIKKEYSVQQSGKWGRFEQNPDPYSFQVSFVFPNYLGSFRDENFKKVIYNILIAETPAHITIYCHWLNQGEMKQFEEVYRQWLQKLPNQPDDVQDVANRLIELLRLGKALPQQLPVPRSN